MCMCVCVCVCVCACVCVCVCVCHPCSCCLLSRAARCLPHWQGAQAELADVGYELKALAQALVKERGERDAESADLQRALSHAQRDIKAACLELKVIAQEHTSEVIAQEHTPEHGLIGSPRNSYVARQQARNEAAGDADLCCQERCAQNRVRFDMAKVRMEQLKEELGKERCCRQACETVADLALHRETALRRRLESAEQERALAQDSRLEQEMALSSMSAVLKRYAALLALLPVLIQDLEADLADVEKRSHTTASGMQEKRGQVDLERGDEDDEDDDESSTDEMPSVHKTFFSSRSPSLHSTPRALVVSSPLRQMYTHPADGVPTVGGTASAHDHLAGGYLPQDSPRLLARQCWEPASMVSESEGDERRLVALQQQLQAVQRALKDEYDIRHEHTARHAPLPAAPCNARVAMGKPGGSPVSSQAASSEASTTPNDVLERFLKLENDALALESGLKLENHALALESGSLPDLAKMSPEDRHTACSTDMMHAGRPRVSGELRQRIMPEQVLARLQSEVVLSLKFSAWASCRHVV